MAKFSYRCTSETGISETGEIEAHQASEAIRLLEARGWIVRSIGEVEPSSEAPLDDPLNSKFESRLQESFQSSKRLIPAFQAIADESTESLVKKEIHQVIEWLSQEYQVTSVLKQPKSLAWIPFLTIGLDSKTAPEQLAKTISQSVVAQENRLRRRERWTYPLTILAIALAIMYAACLWIVPTFESMFLDFGLKLPTPTKLLFAISRWIRFQGGELIAGLIVIGCVLYGIKILASHLAISAKLFGPKVTGNQAIAISRFTSVLAELLYLDAQVPEAIRMAGIACGDSYYAKLAQRIAVELQSFQAKTGNLMRGFPMATNLSIHLMPKLVVHALQAGADGKPSVPLLRELAAIYDERSQIHSEKLQAAFAPISILIIGSMVAFFIVALFMPLTSLITSLSS